MKKFNLKVATITLLTILIISGGCGIVNLLQYKATKINNTYKELLLYNDYNDITTNVSINKIFN